MEAFIQFLSEHASHAHWFILLGLLLAGCNIPVSIDVLVIISAVLAAHFVPENTYLLYSILLVGCSLSAWIAFFLGRTVGHKLKNWRLFSPLLSEKRIIKMGNFYKKYGALAFIIGRFIPFGIRNCLFMTSGLSKMRFLRFALLDLLACSIWVTVFFTLCYHLGQSFDTLWGQVKMLNLFIFLAFSIAVIGVIWYKRVKKPGTEKSRLP